MLPSPYVILIVGFQAAAFTASVISTIDTAIVESAVVDELAHADKKRADPISAMTSFDTEPCCLLFIAILLTWVVRHYNITYLGK